MLKKETIKLQHDLAWYCRDGKIIELDGVRTDRLHHYRRLVYNVMYGLLSKAFPIAKSVLTETEFKEMLNGFFVAHDAQTPEAWKVPGEFFQYVRESELAIKLQYPFLTDLLEMEWSEIFVFNNKEMAIPPFQRKVPTAHDIVVVNPDHNILQLSYPVFKGDWGHISTKKGSYQLLIFRNNETKRVQFMEISALHFKLIGKLSAGRDSLKNSIQNVMDSYNLESTLENTSKLDAFIERLYNDGFIVGKST